MGWAVSKMSTLASAPTFSRRWCGVRLLVSSAASQPARSSRPSWVATPFCSRSSGSLVFSQVAARSAGRAAQAIYNPGGTAVRREYSQADSLVARGKYEDAAAAYEVACLEYPEDPEPYFRLARLLRDHMARYDEAASWFERARAESKLKGLQGLVITQELIELYIYKLRTPRRAIPELTLLCERYPGTPAADVAQRELAEMRDLLAREREGEADFTQEFLKRVDRRES